ncbi:hypothetical protein LY78DRAFT_652581 [Colletotrichum sublineola]|nr:hypothetical protein LY78DRAFT_652581 [Colletotrichum sublineola]
MLCWGAACRCIPCALFSLLSCKLYLSIFLCNIPESTWIVCVRTLYCSSMISDKADPIPTRPHGTTPARLAFNATPTTALTHNYLPR